MTDAVFETSLLVTRLVRAEARRSRPAGLTLSEFRALASLGSAPDSSLTDLADYLGLKLPTTSKLVDVLVTRGEVTRREDAGDRRRNRLALTNAGRAKLDAAMGLVRAHLEERLSGLSDADQQLVLHAMEVLGPLMAPVAPTSDAPDRADPAPVRPSDPPSLRHA
ncbi:MAG: MarR family winged helix-turn-helix transcriptional regulator [Gemmatimonadales bacterium]